jgi:hypothetical protein
MLGELSKMQLCCSLLSSIEKNCSPLFACLAYCLLLSATTALTLVTYIFRRHLKLVSLQATITNRGNLNYVL